MWNLYLFITELITYGVSSNKINIKLNTRKTEAAKAIERSKNLSHISLYILQLHVIFIIIFVQYFFYKNCLIYLNNLINIMLVNDKPKRPATRKLLI